MYKLVLSFLFISNFGFAQNVMIGDQIWMSKNLNVTSFRNGDAIPEAKTEKEWEYASQNKQPAWCYINNDPLNGLKYGRLYNWYAVIDPRGLAPEGFHIPSDIEWSELEESLGVDAVKKMKSTNGWKEYGCQTCQGKGDEIIKNCSACKGTQTNSTNPFSSNGSNSSGFCGLPGSFRIDNGTFVKIGVCGNWWSSTDYKNIFAWDRNLNFKGDYLARSISGKGEGKSIRCIKDNEAYKTETESQTLNFFGIDLNKDFYSLTDASAISYDQYQYENPNSKSIPFYPSKSIDLSEFKNMGVPTVVLYFDPGWQGDFHKLQPSFCMASHFYISQDEFNINGYKDFNILLIKLKQLFGEPNKNIVGNEANSVAWTLSNQQIVLSLSVIEKKLFILCLPQR